MLLPSLWRALSPGASPSVTLLVTNKYIAYMQVLGISAVNDVEIVKRPCIFVCSPFDLSISPFLFHAATLHRRALSVVQETRTWTDSDVPAQNCATTHICSGFSFIDDSVSLHFNRSFYAAVVDKVWMAELNKLATHRIILFGNYLLLFFSLQPLPIVTQVAYRIILLNSEHIVSRIPFFI